MHIALIGPPVCVSHCLDLCPPARPIVAAKWLGGADLSFDDPAAWLGVSLDSPSLRKRARFSTQNPHSAMQLIESTDKERKKVADRQRQTDRQTGIALSSPLLWQLKGT